MTQYNQLSSPFEVVITTPALTCADIVDADFDFDPELHEHFNGKSRFVRITVGNDKTFINFKTTDRAVIAALMKGMEVQGVTLKFQCPVTKVATTGPTYTQNAAVISMTVSTMVVTKSVKISNDSEKKPAEFEIELRAAQKDSDGSDPTITLDLTGAGEPEE